MPTRTHHISQPLWRIGKLNSCARSYILGDLYPEGGGGRLAYITEAEKDPYDAVVIFVGSWDLSFNLESV